MNMPDERDCVPDRYWLLKEGFIHSSMYRELGGMSQDHWEYSIAHNVLDLFMSKPRYILEIGTYGGWTMMGWLRLAAPHAKAVCVDVWKRPSAPLPDSVVFIEADSHSPSTKQEVEKHLPNGVDFLFIDGDHSVEGCLADWNMYAPMVNAGGAVGFHDVLDPNVRVVWREMLRRFPTVQLQNHAPDGSKMGIGLVFRLPHIGPFEVLSIGESFYG